MQGKRFLVLSDKPGNSGITKSEFGVGEKTVSGYASKSFDDLSEARHFIETQEFRLGPLRILDQSTIDLVYPSLARR